MLVLKLSKNYLVMYLFLFIYIVFILVLGNHLLQRKIKTEEGYHGELLKSDIINEKDMIVGLIKKFQPSTKWKTEEGYHGELISYLKQSYPHAKAEHQTGASRPDIVLNNIAIEVKGPTDTQALTTLADKIFRYSNHYSYHIIVLFEPCFSESRYNELLNGIRASHPNVEVIRKDSCKKQCEEPFNSSISDFY